MSSISSRSRLLTASLAVLLIGLFGAGSAQAAGFQTGILDADSYVDTGSSLAFARTEAAGAALVKTNMYWEQIAPAQRPAGFNPRDPGDPAYSDAAWAPYDNFVEQAVAHKLQPILDITDSPEFARSSCTNVPQCAPNPSDYGDFAAAVAKRYSGSFVPPGGVNPLPRVKYFQAWVEPNLDFFLKPTFRGKTPVAPVIYRGMLNSFYDGIKSINSSNQVISAGLAPLARPGVTIGPLDFMRRMLCLRGRANPKPSCGQKTKLDIWATHPYTTGGPTHSGPGPDDVSLGDLPQMSHTLAAADKYGRIINKTKKTPFWATEFSWDSKPPDPGGLPWSIQARWIDEAMYRMYSAGLDAMIWFGLRDQAKGNQTDAEAYQSGLYLRGSTIAKDKPKRALRAFKFPFVALKNGKGFHYWGRTPFSSKTAVTLQINNGSGFRTIGRARANGVGIFEGNITHGTISPHGSVRAIAKRQGTSLPFSLHYVKDFYQPPFGGTPRHSKHHSHGHASERQTLTPRHDLR